MKQSINSISLLVEKHKNDILVFSKINCPYSIAAKKLLKYNQFEYFAYEMDGNSPDTRKRRADLRDLTSSHTVPQVFMKGRHIGGYTDLQKHLLRR